LALERDEDNTASEADEWLRMLIALAADWAEPGTRPAWSIRMVICGLRSILAFEMSSMSAHGKWGCTRWLRRAGLAFPTHLGIPVAQQRHFATAFRLSEQSASG
jgi:hypothetical protein